MSSQTFKKNKNLNNTIFVEILAETSPTFVEISQIMSIQKMLQHGEQAGNLKKIATNLDKS